MRSALVLSLFLTLAVTASASEIWLEPAAPTSHSFIKLQMRSFLTCVEETAVVTRTGNVIEVDWPAIPGCSRITVPPPWSAEAPIGVLEPGVYELRVSKGDPPSLQVRTFVVTDGTPPFELDPEIVTVSGGDPLTLYRSVDLCTLPTEVRIDGAVAPIVTRDCGLIQVTVPPHAAGAADVTAKFGNETLTARAALRYVDPAAAPDESALERVLVPLLYEGPGAYGSQWVTEGRMFPTASHRPLRWLNDAVRAECAIGPCEGENVDLTRFGNHPAGLLLFIPRDLGEVEAKTFVRDTSREQESWGAQVPVVREQDFVRDRAMRFPDVPFTPPYRALLRIYGVDAASSHVRVSAGVRSVHVTLAGACGFYVTPCNSARPAFAAVDLLEAFPELAGTGRVSVTVTPNVATALRYWAFVSVTNNATQHVTLMTP